MMSDDVFFDVEGITKKFGFTMGVDSLSFQIYRGETVCVIGPNSAGKTTLLMLMGGAHVPTKGHITVDGKHRWRDNFELRKVSTFLPAEPVFGACPTPYEFLRFYMDLYGIPKSEFKERCLPLCEEMHLTEHIDKSWGQLSLGMKKKTGLVAAFLPDVSFRILDEPFAGGIDPQGMERLYRWMRAAKDRGETQIFSTQVLEQAEEIADRIMILDHSSILAFDTPAALIESQGVDPADPRALRNAFIKLTGL